MYKANKLLLAGGIGTLLFFALSVFSIADSFALRYSVVVLFGLLYVLPLGDYIILLIISVWAALAIVAASRPERAKAMLVFSIVLAAYAALSIVISLFTVAGPTIPYLSESYIFLRDVGAMEVFISYLIALVGLSLLVLAAVGAMQNMRNPKVSKVIEVPVPMGSRHAGGTVAPGDGRSMGYAVLGFLFPFIGLVLYLVWKDQYPLRAKSTGKGALVSVIACVALTVIAAVIFTIVVVSLL
jgi:hypothetical protein